MNKWWTRLSCLLLAMLLLASVVPAYAVGMEDLQALKGELEEKQEELTEEEESIKDFVLLVDCSETMAIYDPSALALSAIKAFFNGLPVERARVAVITFGYTDKSHFDLTACEYYKTLAAVDTEWGKLDGLRIHEAVSLQAVGTNELKESIKQALEKSYTEGVKQEHTMTPLGHAMAAAVTLLEKSGTAKDDACIILISDGVNEPEASRQNDEALVKYAGQKAGENNWPIYAVQLGYMNTPAAEKAAADKLLDEMCAAGGGKHTYGRLPCANGAQVGIAMESVIADFMNMDIDEPEDIPVNEGHSFEVPILTPEITLGLYGPDIESFTLEDANGNKLMDKVAVNGSWASGIVSAYSEGGGFYSIKMVMPPEGTYTLTCWGKEMASVRFTKLVPQDVVNLTMVASPANVETVLNKDDTITVNSYFSYQGMTFQPNPFYKQNDTAILMAYGPAGAVESFPMTATDNGYTCEVPVNKIPTGYFLLQVQVNSGVFSNGKKSSNVVMLYSENLETAVSGQGSYTATGHANSTIALDLSQFFSNPDGDALEYTLQFNDHPDWFSMVSGGIAVAKDVQEGPWNVRVGAKDNDMADYVWYDGLTLQIGNGAPELDEKIRKVELWSDKYFFQDDSHNSAEIVLGEHFSDPEGAELTFSFNSFDGSILKMENTNGTLTLLPGEKGEVTVVVTASDGVSQTSEEFDVKVVSGKAAFWRDNWIYFAIAGGILFAIVMFIVILLKNKRVKGNWEITLDDNGTVTTIEKIDLVYTPHGKKSKCTLKDLIFDVIPYTDDPDTWSVQLPGYFAGNGADKILMQGVIRKQGCVVKQIPVSDKVKVALNGVTANGKVSVAAGTLTFIIEQPDDTGATLTVTMRLL